MEWLILDPVFLIVIGFLIAGLLIKCYLPSYIKRKGENLATKEDIADITHEEEKVRAEYAKDLEILKSDLQVKVGHQSSFQQQACATLVSFLEDSTVLALDKLDVNAYQLPIESLAGYEKSMGELFKQAELNYVKIPTYPGISDSVLLSAKSLFSEVGAMKLSFMRLFPRAKLALIDEHKAYLRKKMGATVDDAEYYDAVKKAKEAYKPYCDALEQARDRIFSALLRYRNELKRYFDDLGK